MKDIIILGAGENGHMAVDVIEDINTDKSTYNIIGFLDDDENKIGNEIAGFPVMGKMNMWCKYKSVVFTSPLITSPKTNHLKFIMNRKLAIPNFKYENIIHPNVKNKDSVNGVGNFIVDTAVILPGANIGSHCYISSHVLIGPYTQIRNYVNVSNSCTIQGKSVILEGAYLGANSSIIGNTTIGKWSIIGMGSVVIRPVNDYNIVAGNPARIIGKNSMAIELFEST